MTDHIMGTVYNKKLGKEKGQLYSKCCTCTTSHFDKSPFSLIHCDRSESVEIPPHIPTRTRDERVADCSTAQEFALAALEASRPPSSSNTDIRTALLSPLCSGEDLSRKDLPP